MLMQIRFHFNALDILSTIFKLNISMNLSNSNKLVLYLVIIQNVFSGSDINDLLF